MELVTAIDIQISCFLTFLSIDGSLLDHNLLFPMLIGIYFGEPRGIKTNENGQEIGFNTEVYAAYEVFCLKHASCCAC